ncbi:hypothetical protein OsJ_34719 [Oryza sativa Japonica Group]|uniref:Disease resistance R13L4/SHOC-2-like LRR domain-containing protein n=1 Tax=Oryza sativa subsp. japonica TaxID=39947 RepID=B9G8P8_ORYSJ|nr:hypothetical protein OsJ_34719 [Oryza sativa Japonica Group]
MVATIAPDISKTASNFSSWEDTAILETIRGRLGLARFLLVLHDVPSELPWSQILSDTFRFGDSAATRGHKCPSSGQIVQSSIVRLLNVLDLEGCTGFEEETDLRTICTEATHLKYLSLRNTGVTQLPKHIQNLQQLETLDVRGTNVSKLDVVLPMLKELHSGQSEWSLYRSRRRRERLLQTLSISGLHQLVKITLRETYLTGDALYVLGNLRSLRCLRFLPKALAEGIIKFSAGEFSNLVHLFFQEDYIISVIFDHETAPRLETVVFDVKIITSLHGIRNLPSLKDLQIKGELRGEQAVQQAIADHPNSPDYESKIQGKDRYRYSPGLFVLCCICC